jgi:hypothetical protein
MDRLLRRITRASARRMMNGEHWVWGLLALGTFLVRRGRAERGKTVMSLRLDTGDRFLVTLRDSGVSADPAAD